MEYSSVWDRKETYNCRHDCNDVIKRVYKVNFTSDKFSIEFSLDDYDYDELKEFTNNFLAENDCQFHISHTMASIMFTVEGDNVMIQVETNSSVSSVIVYNSKRSKWMDAFEKLGIDLDNEINYSYE